ncbi:uncharacterized protein BJ171DRAFT_502804 [Polychytrium aggregatum]|uniref:uncharacterized protein n=1 Tax=Polychytrium aggregatum TaxID=110093 RepID=UPI0022FEAE43|nr:uncharacterized protein BJ171DRAFT_502804 [Polychytrium aggregatum]KAI9205042.1 hypothetical protein BJ171DRAFT_502804 [Polychytrium aggregatum]
MEIVYDTFWVVFLRIWKAEAENESANKMFLRISQNYVAIFSELKGVDNDEFLEIFPDLLAQTVYRCFCECFPRSTHQFNRDFQIKICDLITEWISGIKPYIPSCVSWKPYIITSQKIQGRMAADSDAAKSHESALDISDTSGYGIDRLGDGIRREKMAPPSCIAGPGPQIRRLWFDTHGNSPIIAKYLEVYGFGSVEKKRIHVHRSEVVRNSVSEDAPTYRQIIMESARNSKRIYRQYLHSQEEAQKERNRMLQELNQQLSKDQRTAWRLLNRPQLVKETADELVEKMHQSIASQAKQKKGVSAVSVGGE